jgi:lipooligosaccharide transport system ATP-binding protein
MTTPPVITATALRKRFGDMDAVAGIDFEVRRGECFGLLGPNGAGKTTTMRMLYRACSVDAGTLRIFGHDVGRGEHDREIKKHLGVVPQNDDLDANLTVRETLQAFARFHRVDRDITALLESFGLTGKADVRTEQLSGGLKRRVQIARSLLGQPDLLILDEPTTGLDPQIRHDLWRRLEDLRREGKTLLLTTHYLDEAERLCDRLVILDRGRIVAAGTPKGLIEEHVASHVIEIRGDAEGLPPNVKVEVVGERTLIYTDHPQTLLAPLAQRGALVRRASLEDVFLKITGRALSE